MTDTAQPCYWSQEDADSDLWNTSCRRAFVLNDGTPTENRMHYCCFCGKPLESVLYVEDET